MDFKFDKNTSEFMNILARNALTQNVRVFFVGGAVRDCYLGVPIKDIDFLIQGSAISFISSLSEYFEILSVHEDFATVKVLYNGVSFDIASTRIESYPYSGCLPVVEKIGVSIYDDVKRRDFTVNSLYVEFFIKNNNLNYKVIDLTKGIKDINSKTLRVLHDRSYIDDPTRILRGLGLKYRFGFIFSPEDEILINNYLSYSNKENFSFARAYSVLEKTFLHNNIDEIFKEFIEKKYYKIFISNDLDIDFSFVQKIIELFSLNIEEKCDFYVNIIKNFNIVKVKLKSSLDIVKFFSKYSNGYLAYYYYKTLDEQVCFYNNIKELKLFICGNDLISLGYPQGRLIGKILCELFEQKSLNLSNFKTKDDELIWVKKNFPLF